MINRYRTAELKFVFALEESGPSVKGTINSAEVKISHRLSTIEPVVAFDLIVNAMRRLGFEDGFIMGRKKASSAQVRCKVVKDGKWGALETDDFYFQYGVAGAYNHGFVLIREKMAGVISDWDEISSAFCQLNGFVQGWMSDVEYNYWQNAKDLMLYELDGKDFSHLPLKSNGLPPPLEESEVDISQNPGRSILKEGYVESVGSVMWLSDLFWERVKSTRDSLAGEAQWLSIEDFCEGVVKIQVKGQEFISERTAEAQNNLRSALYHA